MNKMTPEDQDRLAAEQDTAEERYCLQALAELRRSYERDAKPYIDRLVQLRSTRPVPTITLTLDQAREFIDFTMGPQGA